MPLPSGLALNASTGALVGRPATSAAVDGVATDYTFTVQARDANGLVARKKEVIRIYPAPTVTITAPNGTVGVAYTGSVVGSAGSSPYAYAITIGALPTGLSIHATTGAISGTPTVAGSYTYSVRVTGDKGASTTTADTIVIV